jgi:hypothetical protein
LAEDRDVGANGLDGHRPFPDPHLISDRATSGSFPFVTRNLAVMSTAQLYFVESLAARAGDYLAAIGSIILDIARVTFF